ncbi:hypothetical protein [Yoonia sp. MH D7]
MKPTIFIAFVALAGCMPDQTPVAVSQADQDFPRWITGCSAGPFGGANCPAAQVGAFMAQMPIGQLERDMTSAKFETFALEDVIRRMGAAVALKAETGDCTAPIEQAMVAGEVLRAKVPDNPKLDATDRALFDHLMRIAHNASDYVGKGC